MGEILIAVFIGLWLSGSAFFSYLFLKKENQKRGKNENQGGKDQ